MILSSRSPELGFVQLLYVLCVFTRKIGYSYLITFYIDRPKVFAAAQHFDLWSSSRAAKTTSQYKAGKISPSESSLVTSPVISPNAFWACLNSSASNSPAFVSCSCILPTARRVCAFNGIEVASEHHEGALTGGLIPHAVF